MLQQGCLLEKHETCASSQIVGQNFCCWIEEINKFQLTASSFDNGIPISLLSNSTYATVPSHEQHNMWSPRLSLKRSVHGGGCLSLFSAKIHSTLMWRTSQAAYHDTSNTEFVKTSWSTTIGRLSAVLCGRNTRKGFLFLQKTFCGGTGNVSVKPYCTHPDRQRSVSASDRAARKLHTLRKKKIHCFHCGQGTSRKYLSNNLTKTMPHLDLFRFPFHFSVENIWTESLKKETRKNHVVIWRTNGSQHCPNFRCTSSGTDNSNWLI